MSPQYEELAHEAADPPLYADLSGGGSAPLSGAVRKARNGERRSICNELTSAALT